jgi:G3E family GTPase
LQGDSKAHKLPFEIHRLKGRLALADGKEKIIQGVRELFEIFDSPSQGDGHTPSESGKLVLIGRHLDDFDFEHSLKGCLENPV